MVSLSPGDGASGTDASIALQTLLKFQDEMNAEKLAAAALATKTLDVPNNTGSNTATTVQTISSNAKPAVPADHLDQIA